MPPTDSAPHPSIRPTPEYLWKLPTLRIRSPQTDGETIAEYCRARGFDYRLELKMETATVRYWLCTRCVGEGFPDWNEGVVLMENVQPNEAGEHVLVPYGSDDLKSGQRVDYVRKLMREIERLLEEPESVERDKQLEETRKEIEHALPRR